MTTTLEKPKTTRALVARLNEITLGSGSHSHTDGFCAREALFYVMEGKKADRTPDCLSPFIALLPAINDFKCWKNDAERTEFFRPWWPKLLELKRDPVADQRRAYAMADLAVRVFAADAMESAAKVCKNQKLAEHAAILRALPKITNKETALAGQKAAAEAAAEAAAAARWAEAAAAARWAEAAAAAAARWAEVQKKYATLILETLCAA